MVVYVRSFYQKITEENIESPSVYSEVWTYLWHIYGNQINDDGSGSCFRGKNGESAILTDKSHSNDLVHEIVLVNPSEGVVDGLEKVLRQEE